MSTPSIRPIQKKDNPFIATVIRDVLIEHGVPKVGTAYEDKSLDTMFESYENEKSTYFIVYENGMVLGGGGIAPLENYEGNVCELQKMYFAPKIRGRGYGKKMLQLCLDEALRLGYEACYLETMPYMEAARKLYAQFGFTKLNAAMGDTGHYSCSVHMIKKL